MNCGTLKKQQIKPPTRPGIFNPWTKGSTERVRSKERSIISKDAEDDHAGMIPPPGRMERLLQIDAQSERSTEIVELSESKMEEAAKEKDRERGNDAMIRESGQSFC